MHTRAHTPKQEPSLLRSQCGFVPSVKFFLFRHTFIYIHFPVLCEPHYISRGKNSGKVAAISFIPNRFSFRFSTSRTNGSRSLSQTKASTHSAFGEKSHTSAYTAKHGAFRTGALSLPSTRAARSQISPGRVSERRTLPLWDLGREVLSKNAESLRDSDALMRVAVPRRRGPAGLRDLFSFLSKFMALRPALRAFYACEVGVVSLPPARAAYCRRSRRPLVKAAYLPFSEVGWAPLPVRYFF